VKVQATNDKIEINAVIPVNLTSAQTSRMNTDVTYHCTNMGIIVKWCIASDFANGSRLEYVMVNPAR